MDPVVARNRAVWEEASQKHVCEHQDLLDQARARSSLAPRELEVLRPLLAAAPLVLHLQAGLQIRHVTEHPDPFWQPHGITAAAWPGQLPNTYSLLAQRR